MRVLDVGCGTGDLTPLSAELVGSSGCVVGIDRSTDVLETARARAVSRGYSWVQFLEADAATYAAADAFDVVIGRQVLIHQADPGGVLRHLAGLLRSRGVLAFMEPVMLPLVAWPARPLYSRCINWCVQAFQGAGLSASTVTSPSKR